MAQLGKDSFAAGDRLMPVAEAVELLFARAPCVEGVETIGLVEAEGRVLARALAAPIDLPGFDNSAVDGYAVRFCDLAPNGETILSVEGRVAAGHSPRREPHRRQGRAHLHRRRHARGSRHGFHAGGLPRSRQWSRWRCRRAWRKGRTGGCAARTSRIGEAALLKGRLLRPEDIGLAAALGVDRLSRAAPVPRRRSFSTGDEIVSPGEPLRAAARL